MCPKNQRIFFFFNLSAAEISVWSRKPYLLVCFRKVINLHLRIQFSPTASHIQLIRKYTEASHGALTTKVLIVDLLVYKFVGFTKINASWGCRRTARAVQVESRGLALLRMSICHLGAWRKEQRLEQGLGSACLSCPGLPIPCFRKAEFFALEKELVNTVGVLAAATTGHTSKLFLIQQRSPTPG